MDPIRLSDPHSGMQACTPASLAALSRCIYTDAPLVVRKLQHYRPYICPFDRLLPLVLQGARVLDIGCGAGLYLALLAGSGYQIQGLGFDSSEAAIECAESAARRLNGTVSFRRLDIDDEWPDGRFDVVSLIDVMHHVPQAARKKLIGRAAAKLDPGGLLIYKDMALSPAWMAFANRLHDLTLARQWIQYLPISDVEDWAREFRLELIASEDIRRLWYAHELRVFRAGLLYVP